MNVVERIMPITRGVTAENQLILIVVDQNCNKCRKCVKSCPAEILYIDDSRLEVQVSDAAKCFECRACEVICPVNAIKVN